MEKKLPARNGHSLTDVLVAFAITCILVALTMPAIQQSRESARRNHCAENLKKLGLAIYHYESLAKCLPPTSLAVQSPDGTQSPNSVGPFVRILPYYEQSMTYSAMNAKIVYGNLAGLPVAAHTERAFLCPSEPRGDQAADAQFGAIGGVSYGFCMGTWTAKSKSEADPESTAAFGPHQVRKWSDFTSGLAQTLLMSEVKLHQPYVSATGLAQRVSQGNEPSSIESEDLFSAFRATRTAPQSTGHTRWVDSSVEQIGFTTALTPNRKTAGGDDNQYAEIDLIGLSSDDAPNFAAVTSRSYHAGGVNCLFADGSVRFVSSKVHDLTWRAAGSVSGPVDISQVVTR